MRPFIIALVLALALLAGLAAQAAKAPQKPLDLNRASVTELMQLPGVGRTRAQAIVKFRDAHPFRRAADLLRIKGIGRRTFVRLQPFVTVQPPGATVDPAKPAASDGAAVSAGADHREVRASTSTK